MRSRVILIAAFVAAAATITAAAQTPTLEEVLIRAGEYVGRYQRDFAGIVAQETYEQDAQPAPRFDSHGFLKEDAAKHRELKSDLLLVRPQGGTRWIQFRDVFEVDGRPVRDRTDRLARLFLQPSMSTAKQAEKISEESSRYNVGSVIRNVNVPVLALGVLVPENQHRFLFNHVEGAGAGRTDGAWAIDYREVETGTMIRTGGGQDLPIKGRFWIEPDTGRVLGSTIVAEDRALSAAIDVTYQLEATLHLLVPHEMRESYTQRADGATVTGVATYGNFRQFQVKVDEKIAPIKQ